MKYNGSENTTQFAVFHIQLDYLYQKYLIVVFRFHSTIDLTKCMTLCTLRTQGMVKNEFKINRKVFNVEISLLCKDFCFYPPPCLPPVIGYMYDL